MEKPMRKILNPNLISKKEQREVKLLVKKMLEKCPFEKAMAAVLKKKRARKARELAKMKVGLKAIRA